MTAMFNCGSSKVSGMNTSLEMFRSSKNCNGTKHQDNLSFLCFRPDFGHFLGSYITETLFDYIYFLTSTEISHRTSIKLLYT